MNVRCAGENNNPSAAFAGFVKAGWEVDVGWTSEVEAEMTTVAQYGARMELRVPQTPVRY